MAAEGLRLRLEFEGCVGSGSGSQQVFVRQWFQPHVKCKSIADVAKQVAHEFRLQTPDVLLSLRGFAMARTSPVTLLRDGDIVVVTASSSLQLAGTALDLRLASVGTPDHTIQAVGQMPQGAPSALAVTRAGQIGAGGRAGGPNLTVQAGDVLQRARDNPLAAAEHAEAAGPLELAKKAVLKRKAEALPQAAEDSEKKRRTKKDNPAPGSQGLAKPVQKEVKQKKEKKKKGKRRLEATVLNGTVGATEKLADDVVEEELSELGTSHEDGAAIAALGQDAKEVNAVPKTRKTEAKIRAKEAKEKPKTEKAKKDAKAKADDEEHATSSSEDEEGSDSDSDSDSEEEDAEAAAEEASSPAAKRRRKGPDGMLLVSRNARRKQIKRRLIREGIRPRPPSSTKARAQAMHAAATASPFNPEGVSAAGLPKRKDVVPADPTTKRFVATGHVRFNDTDSECSSEDLTATMAAAAATEEAAAPSLATQQPQQHRGQHSWDYSKQHAPNNPGPARVSQEELGPEPIAFRSHPNLPRSTAAYDALAKIKGTPACGASVAYKLLEIDASFCPQISPWRSGLITGVDAATLSITIVPWPDLMRHPVTGRRVVTLASSNPTEEQDGDEEEEEDGPPSSYDERGILNIPLESLADLRLIPADLPGPPAHPAAAPRSQATPQSAAVLLPESARPAFEPKEAAPGASSAAAEGREGTHSKHPPNVPTTAHKLPNVPTAAQKLLKAVPRAVQIQRAASPAGSPPAAPRPAATSSETPTQSAPAGAAKPTQGQSRPKGDSPLPQRTLRLTPGGPPVRFARLSSSSGGRTRTNARTEFANTMTRDPQVGPPAGKKVPGPVKGASALPASQSGQLFGSPQQKSVRPSQGLAGIGEESSAAVLTQAAGSSPHAHAAEAAGKTVLPGFVAASKGVATGAAAQPVVCNGNQVGDGSALHEEDAGAGTQAADRGERVAPRAMTPGAVKPRPGVRANSVGAFLARLRADG